MCVPQLVQLVLLFTMKSVTLLSDEAEGLPGRDKARMKRYQEGISHDESDDQKSVAKVMCDEAATLPGTYKVNCSVSSKG